MCLGILDQIPLHPVEVVAPHLVVVPVLNQVLFGRENALSLRLRDEDDQAPVLLCEVRQRVGPILSPDQGHIRGVEMSGDGCRKLRCVVNLPEVVESHHHELEGMLVEKSQDVFEDRSKAHGGVASVGVVEVVQVKGSHLVVLVHEVAELQVKKAHSLLGQLVVDAQVLVDIPWLIIGLQHGVRHERFKEGAHGCLDVTLELAINRTTVATMAH
mmetsp:Transcript_61508/g.144033  ORF Transcript_61508/g.144033 Transcript_61508/m.144033 type:complete len:214 (-) Transcript_61508:193-834(-)